MSDIHDTGVLLKQVPTGFGTYTGVRVCNYDYKETDYVVSLSSNELFKGPNNDPLQDVDALNLELYQTLFLSEDVHDLESINKNINILDDDNELSFSLMPGESKDFYIAHRPFNDFSSLQAEQSGIETALIKIKSSNKDEEEDDDIFIRVTGQRILDPLNPDRNESFVAYKTLLADNSEKFRLHFRWDLPKGQNFITGFGLQLSSDNTFSTLIQDGFIKVPQNENVDFLPDYLLYLNNGLSYAVALDVPYDTDIFARVKSFNGLNEPSDYTYCKGLGLLNNASPAVLEPMVANGTYEFPGDNLGSFADSETNENPDKYFVINYYIDGSNSTSSVDIFQAMREEFQMVNNTLNISNYTGGYFNIIGRRKNPGDETSYSRISKTNDPDYRVLPTDLADVICKTENRAPVVLNKGLNDEIIYGVNDENRFNLIITLENVSLQGFNGEGCEWVDQQNNNIGSFEAGSAGLSVFDLDNLNSNGKYFDYYIYKDKDTILRAGLGGPPCYRDKKNTDDDITDDDLISANNGYFHDEKNLIDYVAIENYKEQYDYSKLITSQDIANLPYSNYTKEIDSSGLDADLVKNNGSKIYMGFSERDPISYNRGQEPSSQGDPSYNAHFGFTSASIGEDVTVGTATDRWISSINNVNLAFHNKNSNSPLVVREAYGKKFYELLRNGGQSINDQKNEVGGLLKNAISVYKIDSTNNNITEDRPNISIGYNLIDKRSSYCVFVFALAKKTLDDAESFYGSNPTLGQKQRFTSAKMLQECPALHRFISVDSLSDFPIGTSSAALNLERNTNYNFFSEVGQDEYFRSAIFSASSLNSSHFIVPETINNVIGGNGMNNQKINFRNFVLQTSNSRVNAFENSNSVINTKGTFSDEEGLIWGGVVSSFGDYNLANTQNAEKPQVFTMNEGGSTTDFEMFELFFVQMHTDFTYDTMNNVVGQTMRQQTFINGKAVNQQFFRLHNESTYNYFLGLKNEYPEVSMYENVARPIHNPTNGYDITLQNLTVDNDDSDKQTRLFLFDYIYGVSNESEGSAEGIADRDLRSDSLLEDLVYQYAPLLTRNNSNLLTIKDSNTNMSFPVPGTHPYFNIFSK